MLLPISFNANCDHIKQHKQELINNNNARENAKCIEHEYKVGDLVLLEKPGVIPKLAKPRQGPFSITHVYTNGTVRIQRGAINDRVNIPRLTPYTAQPN